MNAFLGCVLTLNFGLKRRAEPAANHRLFLNTEESRIVVIRYGVSLKSLKPWTERLNRHRTQGPVLWFGETRNVAYLPHL